MKRVQETRRAAVRKLLTDVSQQIDKSKISISDYIRLLQYEKELEAAEPPEEVRVKWVDLMEESSSET